MTQKEQKKAGKDIFGAQLDKSLDMEPNFFDKANSFI